MDPFLVRKWAHAFNTFFDTNKSSSLEWADFELLIQKIKERRGEKSEDYRSAQAAMKKIWDGLVTYADTNKDNQVSLDEWNAMWSAVSKSQKYPEWQEAYLSYMFKLLDSSGDGVIDCDEYCEVMSMYGLAKGDAVAFFKQWAVVDGKPVEGVDMNAFKTLWNQYFLSTDPKAQGNAIFGSIQ